ncbi:MAG: peptidylprolyl isomerase [Clostridia bacterium]|nr:peptidylprolyl isomerase [Clostridia bacterium]
MSNDFSTYTEKFGFTADDFIKAMELTTLASKMYDKAITDMAIDDAKIEQYFKTNEKYFKMVDYNAIVIPYGENGWYDEASAAKSAADHIAKATTTTAFDKAVREVLSAIGASANDIETELQSAKQTGIYYKDDDAVSTWAFGTAKVGNTYVATMDSAYAVYQLTTLPYIDDAATVNVRHILVSSEDEAKEVLAEWKKGDKTAESFGKLAEQYTEDPGSKETGGLYQNVSKGEMVEAFDTWIFDEKRKDGDTDIVKTEHGYHVMYFAGEGSKAWEIGAENAMIAENVDKLCAEYTKTWPVTTKNGVIGRLPM